MSDLMIDVLKIFFKMLKPKYRTCFAYVFSHFNTYYQDNMVCTYLDHKIYAISLMDDLVAAANMDGPRL